MSFTKCGLRLFLALLLVFSQQQAVLHLLGHDFEHLARQQPKDAPDPQELVCAKCLAVAHLDHAIAVSLPAFEPAPATFEIVAAAAPQSLDLAFVARYRSRAPPVLS